MANGAIRIAANQRIAADASATRVKAEC